MDKGTEDELMEEEDAEKRNENAGKLTNMLYLFGKDLSNLHKDIESLQLKALLYNNKYIVSLFSQHV